LKYLLDTNIVSETVKPAPNKGVVSFLGKAPSSSLYLSVLTFGEIRKGIDLMESGKRRTLLTSWIDHTLTDWFSGRLMPISASIAQMWGHLSAKYSHLPAIDGLIAATAVQNNMTLVTRNTKDFQLPELQTLNPFTR
jgi:predicted nucleic acid-binding protein